MKKVILVFVSILLSGFSFAQHVSIGDILCTDGSIVKPNQFQNSGKTAKAVVFYVDASNLHGWAVHPHYQGQALWSPETIDIPELNNYQQFREAIKDVNGYENTSKIRQAGDSYLFPAAWAVDFSGGWYLPAAGQIRQLYGYIPEVNQSLLIINGTPFNLTPDWWLWASTEGGSDVAWDINYLGSEGHSKKNDHYFYVRSIINF